MQSSCLIALIECRMNIPRSLSRHEDKGHLSVAHATTAPIGLFYRITIACTVAWLHALRIHLDKSSFWGSRASREDCR